MAHDEAVATQRRTGKTASPPKVRTADLQVAAEYQDIGRNLWFSRRTWWLLRIFRHDKYCTLRLYCDWERTVLYFLTGLKGSTPYHKCLMDYHHFAGPTSSLTVSWLVSHAGSVFCRSLLLSLLTGQRLEHGNLSSNSEPLQAYYGHGVLPPAYFAPPMAPGHPPPPYMWGTQVFDFLISVLCSMMFPTLYWI